MEIIILWVLSVPTVLALALVAYSLIGILVLEIGISWFGWNRPHEVGVTDAD